MENFFRQLILACICLLTSSLVSLSGAQEYDNSYLPIKPQELHAQLYVKRNNSTEMILLLHRANNNGMDHLAFSTMDELRKKFPDDPEVLAAYCFAYDVNNFSSATSHVPLRNEEQEQDFQAALERAKKLKPDFWLTTLVEGQNLAFSVGNTDKQYEQGFELLRKAEVLAPELSFTSYELSKMYGFLAPRRPNFKAEFRKKEAALNRALKAKPALARYAIDLLDIYEYRLPDAAKARQTAQLLRRLLPPEQPAKAEFRNRMAKYGIQYKPK